MTGSTAKINAVLLIVLILAALVIRLWASNNAEALLGPMTIRTGPNETVYFMCDDKLYIHQHDGGLVDAIPLSRFGIFHYVDDFWVYNNGDLLLRRDIAHKSFMERMFSVLRSPGPRMADKVVANESIVQRCRVDDFSCSSIENSNDSLRNIGIFRVFIDEAKGNFYVSDNLGHELMLLDLSGKLLRRSGRSFEYPNQLRLGNDGLLYVADTENHRITGVSTDYATFGRIEREFKISNSLFGDVYPVSLAQMPSGDWWVIAAGITMRYGTLMVYSKDGSFAKTIPLPDGADPFSLVALQDRVLVTDPGLMRIYTIGFDGTLHDDFGSDSLRWHLSELQRRKSFYASLSTLFLWVLVAGLIFALLLARSSIKTRGQKTTDNATLSSMPLSGPINRKYDYHSLLGMFRILSIVTLVLLMITIILVYALPGKKNADLQPVLMCLLFSPIGLMIVYYQIKNNYIEIPEKGICYVSWNKKRFASWHEVRKIKTIAGYRYIIYTDKVKIPVARIEPADGPKLSWSYIVRNEGLKHAQELVEEIKKRAPHVELI